MTQTHECKRAENASIIQDTFCQSLRGVIDFYSTCTISVEPTSRPSGSDGTASILDFSDQRFTGAAVLLASNKSLENLPGGRGFNPVDWLCELNNQVVGRLRNHLLRMGVPTKMGTPRTVSGKVLNESSFLANPYYVSIKWEQDEIIAIVDLQINEDFEFVENDEAEIAEEGSVELF